MTENKLDQPETVEDEQNIIELWEKANGKNA